jgi:hypothetical protein
MTWLTILGLLRKTGGALTRVPGFVWAILVGAGMAYGAWWLHHRAIDIAVLRDRTQQSAASMAFVNAFYAGERKKARAAVTAAEAETRAAWASRDSAVVRSKQLERALAASTRKVTSAIAVLPDSIRKLPGVAGVVDACTALANDCEQLRVAVVAERAETDSAKANTERERTAREAERILADSALRESGKVIAAQQDSVAVERTAREKAERRPTWKRVAGIVVVVGATTWQVTKALVTRGAR